MRSRKLNEKEKFTWIGNEKIWVEQAALDQLAGVSRLPDVIRTVGMPDLHPGKSPVGFAALSQGRLYPHLIGNDIGCGMGLFTTGVKLKKFRQDKWLTKLNYIRELADLRMENPYVEESPFQDLGTIGSGNHFIEFQCVENIVEDDSSMMDALKGQVLVLVHSGSRGYGQVLFSQYAHAAGLLDGSVAAKAYLAAHDHALLWARRNRMLAAQNILQYIGVRNGLETVLDCCHNFIEQTAAGWVHRKGAVSALQETVIIPGSRGSLAYICRPTQNTEWALHSLSHGAGRKWARSLCKSRINHKYDRDSIRCTQLKSKVVCHDTNLLFQEAPEAYKNIETIIAALTDFGLIKILATLRPLITYKG